MNQHQLTEDLEHLADQLDRGARSAMDAVNDGIAHVRRAAEQERARLGAPTGFCMFCDAETMDPTARFCDHECAADWQREQDAKRRNGES